MRNPVCNLCPRRESANPNNICLYGNALPDSTREIMIIVDTVSNASNSTGKLLDGQGGTVLRKLLESVNILHKSYITTAVKCYGDKPKAEHIKACRHYLLEEIKEVKPKLIICLGTVATQALIGKHTPAKQLRQRFITTTSGIKVAVTFSHNSIFINPHLYNQCQRDMQWIMHNYKKEEQQFTWKISLEPDTILESNIYGLDIETTGLSPYVDKILTIAIANPNIEESYGYNISHKGNNGSK